MSAEISESGEDSVFMVSDWCLAATLTHGCCELQSTSRIQCNIGFAELAVNLSDEHIATTIPVLIDILRDIPHINFDKCMAWDGELFVFL
jgi:hypothetical protein